MYFSKYDFTVNDATYYFTSYDVERIFIDQVSDDLQKYSAFYNLTNSKPLEHNWLISTLDCTVHFEAEPDEKVSI